MEKSKESSALMRAANASSISYIVAILKFVVI
jgi:hypothetical protein